LREAVSTVRSYNTCFALGFQSKTQLDALYGRDVASGIITDCNTLIATRTNDGDTADFIARAFGGAEVINKRENITFSAHDTRDSVNLQQYQTLRKTLIPSEIMELKNLHYVFKGVDGCTKGEIEYKGREIIAPHYIPDESKRFLSVESKEDYDEDEGDKGKDKDKDNNNEDDNFVFLNGV
jgi:type IV secretory pathway TraG/TraD family ATPase VirD4